MNEPTNRTRILTVAGVALIALLIAGSAFSLRDTLAPLGARLLAAVFPSTLFALANHDRAQAGVSSLTENPLLDKAAQMKADDMAAKGYFAHITPSGDTPLHFLNQVGYRYQNVGENLGLNYDDAQSVETAWLNSPKHREALLYSQFTEIGIGVANGMYEGAPATFVVAFLATPLPASAAAAKPTSTALPIKTGTPTSLGIKTPLLPGASSTATTKETRIQEIKSAIIILQDAITRLTTELNTLK